jgi:hypothetical protein
MSNNIHIFKETFTPRSNIFNAQNETIKTIRNLGNDSSDLVTITLRAYRWKAIANTLESKQAIKKYKVTVLPMSASNGVTYVVCLTHPDRPVDAKLWDEGIITPINRNDVEEANIEGQQWADFLGAEFTPCKAIEEFRHDGVPAVNTVPEYGEVFTQTGHVPLAYAPLTKVEIEDLTAMIWGAPIDDDWLAKVLPILRAYEEIRKTGERPIDTVDGGRFLDVEGAFPEEQTKG